MKRPVSTHTTGIYLLAPEHAAALQMLSTHPEIAAAMRRPLPSSPEDARQFVERGLQERAEGRAHVFVIMDRKVVGLSELRAVGGEGAHRLSFWVGHDYWGKGYASFAVKMVLQFAFQNLCLAQVAATTRESNGAATRVLLKNGFQRTSIPSPSDPSLPPGPEVEAVFEIKRAGWLTLRHSPTLASLHPALQGILAAELAAGNEIGETSRGWPETASVFVKLRFRFRAAPMRAPTGTTYTESPSPHSWPADYSTPSPRHILACGEA